MPIGTVKIEIVGVAGTGKSTLARTLRERHTDVRIADSLHTRAFGHWPHIAHSIPALLPLARASLRSSPALSWEEIKFAIYVAAWKRYFTTNQAGPGLIIMDQGPIFALARLLWGDKPVTHGRTFRLWLEGMVEMWSRELDAIVVLTAPLDVLLERIEDRAQGHETKGQPRHAGRQILDAHRSAYNTLLGLIEELRRPPVLLFDTSAMSPIEISESVVQHLNGDSELQIGSASGGIRDAR